MYDELYMAWQWEINSDSLGRLPPNFYLKIATYLNRILEEKNSDKKNVKTNLLEKEEINVNRMLEELLRIRYRKIIKKIGKNHEVPTELLTLEENKMCETFANFAKSYQEFTEELMKGQKDSLLFTVPKIDPLTPRIFESKTETSKESTEHKMLTLRFMKNIPAIMGTDMKSYGPFSVEDVASLPAVNAKMLVKQGLAVLVEIT